MKQWPLEKQALKYWMDVVTFCKDTEMQYYSEISHVGDLKPEKKNPASNSFQS